MKVTFLGGTEIGASCILFQTEETAWLVDAGTRMDDRDPLPSLDKLAGVRVDAIFVTHAHQDHIGSLPILSGMFPEAPVFMTAATLDLARVMLADALKVGEMEGKAVFSQQQLDLLWSRVRVMGQDKVFGWRDLQVATYSAGHILGAVSIGFITENEGSVLITGDYSVTPGRLLPGLHLPKGTSYDVVITESTYGNRLHGNRSEQEAKLARQVAEVIEQGGFVVIPAFAVGRAQEVLMILQDSMRYNKDYPKFPLVADGLVRSVCPVYEAHDDLLRGPAKRMLRTKGTLFDREEIRFIRRPEERQRVLEGKPACIVSSSGMLTGGPSVFYADKLGRDAKNAILLCGYQDEESPGRKLLDMAQQPEDERRWILPDRVVPIHASVSLYSLSAHADRREIVQVLANLRPRQVLLVHGDEEAKAMLGMELRAFLPKTDIRAVELGETVELVARKRAFQPGDTAEGERPVNAHTWAGHILVYKKPDQPDKINIGVCKKVEASACVVEPKSGLYERVPIGMILDALGRVPPGEDVGRYLGGLWNAARACVEENRIWGYRPAERLGYRMAEMAGQLVAPDPLGLEAVIEALAPYGWRKVDPDEESKTFRIFLEFPWAVPDEVRQDIEQKETDAGWRYVIEPHVYPPAVERLVHHGPGGSGLKVGNLRMRPQERQMEIPVIGHLPLEKQEKLQNWLQKRIGGTVRLIVDGNPVQTTGRMEQNAAMGFIKIHAPDWMEVQKVGVNREAGICILTVPFPDAVKTRPESRAFAEEMERATGWSITWNDAANQGRLAELALSLCREAGIDVAQNPSIYPGKVIRVRLASGMKLPEHLERQFRERTGWTLERLDETTETVDSSPDRMEINQALAKIEASAKERGITVYKKSVIGDSVIELMFITPEAGREHQDWLEALSQEIGWTVRVADKVHQQALIQLVQELAGELGLAKTPGVHLDKKRVAVRTEKELNEGVKARFKSLTGWELVTG